MDVLAQLNPEQAAAARHEGGPLLVVAGAGTGKTLTLAARVAWLVAQGADPNRLLLLTFSRRAAVEMARRAGRLLHTSRGLGASVPPPLMPWCGTFHGVAARLLREEAGRIGLPAGFTVLDRADAEDLMAIARQSLGLARGETRFPMAPTCLAIHSRCINTQQDLPGVLAESYPWCVAHEAALLRLFAAFAANKLQQHSLDYDDLLLAWWHLMQQPAIAQRLRGRFDHVLVDEVQDVNRLQSGLMLALQPQGQGLTAVGDDAQSIYAFRGADVRHILDLPLCFNPPARVLALQRNYRSTPEVLAASNAVMALAAERFDKTLWTARAAARKPGLHVVADEAEQARGVADAVLAEREAGVLLRHQAVLFRTTSHSAALELELTRRGVPFVKYGGLRFLEAAHVKDLLSVLRWADNPGGQLAAQRVARLVPGMGPASVARLLAHTAPLEDFVPPVAARVPWRALLALMQQLRTSAPAWPLELGAVLAWYRPHLERLHDNVAVRWADLLQVQHIAQGHASRERFVTELTLDPPEASSDESGAPHRDEDYLILSTIHSSKGQEWNAVHILNVVDGCLPADMATGRAAEIEEERRLLYVAMTRARDRLDLWVPQRFHITQQRAWGGGHLYALRSRFVPDELLVHFDQVAPQAEAAPGAGATSGTEVAFDLRAALGGTWSGGGGGAGPPAAGQAGQNPDETPTRPRRPPP